ncbi:CvpA family protein [Calidifontibacillus oryziterrae]|uniref:CvpA family protein n=1 Tax=Calidifontibacillus oryziterrae TaxID=1191699 RepID=UPI000310CCB6|nr:CvpA family protein [Calidifontibacillus oryziterrae]
MIDIILLSLLLIGFFIGFRRGFVLQVVYFVGFIAAYVVAYLFFDDVAPFLKLWVPFPPLSDDSAMSLLMNTFDIETVYYRAIAFVTLFFGTKISLHIIGSMLDFLADLPLLRTVNGWLGGALGFVEVYLLLFIVLYLGALTPIEAIQSWMNESIVAKGIVENTPVVSVKLKELWFGQPI